MDAAVDAVAEPCSLPASQVVGAEGAQEIAAATDARSNWAPSSKKQPKNVTVERLKGDLAYARQQKDNAEREQRLAEAERQKLVEQVVGLEAQRRSLQQEAEQWRQRYLGMEQECATSSTREDAAQAQLREAHSRERDLAVRAIEGRIACTQAENAQAKAVSDARAQSWQAQQLEVKLHSLTEDFENVREQLRDARSGGETWRVEAESLRVQLRDCMAERDGYKDSLADAERRHGVLEARISSLETALQAASNKQADFSKEVASHHARSLKLEETNRRLRLDLQEAIGQAVRTGEIPFYSGGGDRSAEAVPASVQDAPRMGVWRAVDSPQTSPRSPRSPLSARSRLDYPKSSHAVTLRQKVLTAREEAIDYTEQLGRMKP